jgi:small subunit ribosomal protein S3
MDQDFLFRWLRERCPQAQIARVASEGDQLLVLTARPGVIIGKGGARLEALRSELAQLGGPTEWHIHEIRRPELEPVLVADALVMNLEAGVDPESAIVRAAQRSIRAGARWVWLRVTGALWLSHEEAAEGEAGAGELRSAVREAQLPAGAISCEVQLRPPS